MRLGLIVAILAAVAIGGGLVLWLAAPNIAGAVRPLLARQIESLTGRALTIGGDMTVAPSLAPTVVAHKVTLKNAEWGSDRPMLEVEALEIELRLIPLLFHGEVVIDRLALSGATLLIEERADGTLNWENAKATSTDGGVARTPPFLADFAMENSTILVHDMADDAWDRIAVETLSWSADSATAPLEVSARGTANDIAITFAGRIGPIAELLGGAWKTTVDLTGTAQTAAVTAKGTLDLAGRGNDLAVTARGDEVAALGPLFEVALPALGAYEAEGRLVGTVGAPSLEDARARVGSAATAGLRAAGARVGKIYHFRDAALPITLKADDLAQAGRALGLTLPSLKPVVGTATLVRESKAYTLQELSAKAGTGATQMTVNGAVADLFGKPDVKLDALVTAGSVDAVGHLIGHEFGWAGPLRLQARLSGGPSRLHIANLSGALAKSDLRGALTVDLAASPTAVSGTLESKRLDLQGLAGGDTLAKEDRLPIGALRDAELHVRLKAETIVLADATVGPAGAQVDLKDGKLALSDIDIRMLGGTVESSAVVTQKDGAASDGPLALLNLRLHAKDLDLSKVLAKAGTAPAGNLELDAEVTVDSKGRTPDQLLADLSGEASVHSEGGKILEGRLNKLVQDVDPIRLLLPFWRRADVVNVRCLVGSADIKQGVAQTDVMFDTQHMTVLGKGTVNLRDRQINMTLDPSPKSGALSATGVPVQITGPLGAPKVEPRTREAVGGLFKGLLGGLVVPLNQLARVFGKHARDACASAVSRR